MKTEVKNWPHKFLYSTLNDLIENVSDVAYYFTNHLTGTSLSNVTKQDLEACHQFEIKAKAFTFDGNIKFSIPSKPSTNSLWKKNQNQIQADIVNSAQMKTNLKHSVTGEDVYVLLGSNHMLKLVRNLLVQTENRIMIPGFSTPATWSYIGIAVNSWNREQLFYVYRNAVYYQNRLGFRVGKKLGLTHTFSEIK